MEFDVSKVFVSLSADDVEKNKYLITRFQENTEVTMTFGRGFSYIT